MIFFTTVKAVFINFITEKNLDMTKPCYMEKIFCQLLGSLSFQGYTNIVIP